MDLVSIDQIRAMSLNGEIQGDCSFRLKVSGESVTYWYNTHKCLTDSEKWR